MQHLYMAIIYILTVCFYAIHYSYIKLESALLSTERGFLWSNIEIMKALKLPEIAEKNEKR